MYYIVFQRERFIKAIQPIPVIFYITIRDGKVYKGTASYSSDILFTIDGFVTIEEFVAIWDTA
jgi:hypothetical protein